MNPLKNRGGRWLAGALCACVAMAAPAADERGPRSSTAAEPASGSARVIVKFKANSSLVSSQLAAGSSRPQHAKTLSQRLGVSLTDGRAIDARTQVVKAANMSSAELAASLSSDGDVEFAEVDQLRHRYAAPTDPLYATGQSTTPTVGQWYLRAPTGSAITSTSVVSSINAEAAWAVTTGSSSIVVAVLDTGVRFDHPDFTQSSGTSKLYAGYDFVADTSISNDGNGRDSDAADPGDWTSSETSSWHGTQTAGLVGAATNNGVGMASAGRDVMVLPVRVLGSGGGYDSDIQAAMRWAAGLSVSGVTTNTHPAKVINMSLGASGSCSSSYQSVVTELTAVGVVVVAAAGNDGLAVGSPANCSGVIAVAGVRHTGTKVGYSNLGPEVVVSAPAGNCVNSTGTCLYPILSTSNSGTSTPVSATAGGSIYTGGGDNASLGTSFSSPLVAGTVGLMLSANPALTPAQVISLLKSSARTFPSSGAGSGVSNCTAPSSTAQESECYCTTSTCGAGMLNAGAAVAAAAAAAATTAVASPAASISVGSSSVAVGTSVTLDASASTVDSSRSIASYLWTITSGASIASFTSGTNAATATLLPTAAGTVVVSLTITDSAGSQSSASTTLTVSAASTSSTSTSSLPSGNSSGGGGLDGRWLIGLLLGVMAMRGVTAAGRSRRVR